MSCAKEYRGAHFLTHCGQRSSFLCHLVYHPAVNGYWQCSCTIVVVVVLVVIYPLTVPLVASFHLHSLPVCAVKDLNK